MHVTRAIWIYFILHSSYPYDNCHTGFPEKNSSSFCFVILLTAIIILIFAVRKNREIFVFRGDLIGHRMNTRVS